MRNATSALAGWAALVSIDCVPREEAGCGEGVYSGGLIPVDPYLPDEPLGTLTLFIGPIEQSTGLVQMNNGVLPHSMQLDVDLDCSVPNLWASEADFRDCTASTFAELELGADEWVGEFRGECYPESSYSQVPIYSPPSTLFRFRFTAHRVGPSLTAAER